MPTEVDQEVVDFAVSQFSRPFLSPSFKENDCYTLGAENFKSQVDLSRCMIVIDIDCVFYPGGGRDDLHLRPSPEAQIN